MQSPLFVAVAALIFGLLVGSFLNVVIYRLPIVIEGQWFQNISEILREAIEKKKPTGMAYIDRLHGDQSEEVIKALTIEGEPKTYRYLAWPPSSCPNCDHKIKSYENIPLISWLLLKGRCAGCQTAISKRYPLIELLTGLLSAGVGYQYGFTVATAAFLLFTWVLIALTFIDFEHYILPDELTLPTLWLGMILAYFELLPLTFSQSFFGAIFGYLAFWSVAFIYKVLFGREGMGHGDFKLLALLGAWFGASALLPIIVLSTFIGSIVGITLIYILKWDRNRPIPFGPYLALAGISFALFQDQLLSLFPTI